MSDGYWVKFKEATNPKPVIGTLLGVFCVDSDGEAFVEFGYLDEIAESTFAIRNTANRDGGTLRYWFDNDTLIIDENDISEILVR